MIRKSFLQKKNKRWFITDKMFISLFLTGTIIEFSQVGAGFVDGLVISRFLGPEAMAAEGIVHPIYSILGLVSGLLASGMQVRCAQAIGRGNRKEYCNFVSFTIALGLVLSFAVMGLTLLFAEPFTVFLGASGNAANLVEPASKYLIGIGIGIPPLIMTAIFAPALQLDTGRKTIRTGALIETVSNITMDLVAAKMGWGIFGIGLATAAASYLNLMYQCTFFLKKDRILHFVRPNIQVRDFTRMMADGSENAVKRLANTVRPVILNTLIISYGGVTAMSVLSARNSFSNFVEIFGAGIASAVALLTSVYYGEINEEAIEEVNKCEHKSIMLFSGSVCVLLFIFARPLVHLYFSEDSETINMGVFVFRMLALQTPLQALIKSRIKYLQAICRKINMNLLTLAAQVIFVTISAFSLGRLFGTYGILACFTLSDLLTLFSVYVLYAVKNNVINPTRKEYLNLPDSFFLNPGDLISLDIRNSEDVSIVSEQIMLFCKGHKIDPKISYFSALSFEELASNIVQHAFPNSQSPNPMIDLRAVFSDGKFVIRMRDNCPSFDVTELIATANKDDADITRNIGIRIVSKTASDITYLRTFDTNNIILCYDLNKK